MANPIIEEFKRESILRMRENIPRIEKCLNSLSEQEVWGKPNASSNSIANLILHLCGNIRQYILSSLGGIDDDRQRDKEFSSMGGISTDELKIRFLSTITDSIKIIEEQGETDLMRKRMVQGFELTGMGIIIHVVEHLSYHTGQIAFWTKALINKDLDFYAGKDLNKKNP